jgi:rod shape-determining protein MreC
MRSVRKTFTLLAVLIVLLFVSLHLLSVGVRRKVERGQEFAASDRVILAIYAPVERVLSWPFRQVRRGWDGYVALVGLKRENAALRAEVDRLRADQVKTEELRREAMQLREIVGYTDRTGAPIAVARVAGQSFLPEIHTILVDRGAESGVEPGTIAVTPKGLVGYVTGAARGIARVRLITDPLSAVNAVVQRSRANGVVKGSAGGVCRLHYVRWTDDVKPGDLVLSSGQGVFPPGITIGYVARIERSDKEYVEEMIVKTAVDFDRLDLVTLLPGTPRATQPPLAEEFAPVAPGDEPEDAAR